MIDSAEPTAEMDTTPLTQEDALGMEYPYGDSYEVLPAKAGLPPLSLAVTASEANLPGYSDLKRHILAALAHERPISWGILLASAYVSLLRVQRVLTVLHDEPGLSDRICIALQKIVTWAYFRPLRLGFCH